MVVAVLPFVTVTGLGAAVRLKSPRASMVSPILVVAVRPSSVPVTVMVDVPAVAPAATVKVNTVLLTAGFWLNDAVTSLGKPDTEKLTGRFCGVMITVVAPVLPCATLTEFGEASSINPSFNVSLSVVVLVRTPEVPVIVTVVVPVGAVALAAKVIVLLDVAGFELNEAVTPFGSPETVRATSELNPLAGVMVILLDPWLN